VLPLHAVEVVDADDKPLSAMAARRQKRSSGEIVIVVAWLPINFLPTSYAVIGVKYTQIIGICLL